MMNDKITINIQNTKILDIFQEKLDISLFMIYNYIGYI